MKKGIQIRRSALGEENKLTHELLQFYFQQSFKWEKKKRRKMRNDILSFFDHCSTDDNLKYHLCPKSALTVFPSRL